MIGYHPTSHPTIPDARPLGEQRIAYETLPVQVAKAFSTLDLKTWEDVASCSPAQFLMFKGLGRIGHNYINDEIQRRSGNPYHNERSSLEPPPFRVRVMRLSDIPTRGGVYFLKCSTLVKIGSAKDVRNRFRTIWRMNPFPLELMGIIEPDHEGSRTIRQIESEYHRRFRKYREFGEWFRYEAELRDFCFTLEHAARERDFMP